MVCEICKMRADGIYHILPTDFIESVNFHTINKDEDIIPLTGDDNCNCTYLCDACKNKFLDRPVVPGGRLQAQFEKLSIETRQRYCDFILTYKRPIMRFLFEMGIQYSDSHRLFITNMQYTLLYQEFLEFYRLFEERSNYGRGSNKHSH